MLSYVKWSVEVKFTIFTIKLTQLIRRFQNYRSWFQRLQLGMFMDKWSEIQLENTLLDFIEGQYDILVTTTIIETG